MTDTRSGSSHRATDVHKVLVANRGEIAYEAESEAEKITTGDVVARLLDRVEVP